MPAPNNHCGNAIEVAASAGGLAALFGQPPSTIDDDLRRSSEAMILLRTVDNQLVPLSLRLETTTVHALKNYFDQTLQHAKGRKKYRFFHRGVELSRSQLRLRAGDELYVLATTLNTRVAPAGIGRRRRPVYSMDSTRTTNVHGGSSNNCRRSDNFAFPPPRYAHAHHRCRHRVWHCVASGAAVRARPDGTTPAMRLLRPGELLEEQTLLVRGGRAWIGFRDTLGNSGARGGGVNAHASGDSADAGAGALTANEAPLRWVAVASKRTCLNRVEPVLPPGEASSSSPLNVDPGITEDPPPAVGGGTTHKTAATAAAAGAAYALALPNARFPQHRVHRDECRVAAKISAVGALFGDAARRPTVRLSVFACCNGNDAIPKQGGKRADGTGGRGTAATVEPPRRHRAASGRSGAAEAGRRGLAPAAALGSGHCGVEARRASCGGRDWVQFHDEGAITLRRRAGGDGSSSDVDGVPGWPLTLR